MVRLLGLVFPSDPAGPSDAFCCLCGTVRIRGQQIAEQESVKRMRECGKHGGDLYAQPVAVSVITRADGEREGALNGRIATLAIREGGKTPTIWK